MDSTGDSSGDGHVSLILLHVAIALLALSVLFFVISIFVYPGCRLSTSTDCSRLPYFLLSAFSMLAAVIVHIFDKPPSYKLGVSATICLILSASLACLGHFKASLVLGGLFLACSALYSLERTIGRMSDIRSALTHLATVIGERGGRIKSP